MRKVKTGKNSVKKSGRVSLMRALSKLSVASREEARNLIESGKVKVHGSIEADPNRMVNPDSAHIEVNGLKAARSERIVLVFHKPTGCLTTKRDPEGRPTIYDFLPEEHHSLHAVGRLDMHTSGLLLLTNDTRFSSYLTDPKNEIERTYVVEVRGEFTEEDRAALLVGVRDDEELLQAKEIRILKTSGKESRIEVTLVEGKNREIRRMCLSVRHEVVSLKRVRFGKFLLEDLKAGKFRLSTEINE